MLVCLWLAFLLRGLFFASTTPIWEGFDEHAHFAVIDSLARGHAWPAASEGLPAEIEASLGLLPLPKLLAGADYASHTDYWAKPPAERSELQRRFLALSPQHESTAPASQHRMYEAQQAPAYYWFLAAADRLVLDWPLQHWPLASRVCWLRLLTLFLGSLLVPFTYGMALRIGSPQLAQSTVLLLVAMPQITMSAARIANDLFAAAAVAWVLWQVAQGAAGQKSPWRAVLLGLSAGLALLSKGYLIILLVALVVDFWAEWITKPPGRQLIQRNGCIALAMAALSGGWWYGRNLLLSGSLSGEQMEVASRQGLAAWISEFVHMDWVRAVDFISLSHLWLGNWSFLVLRSWMYHTLEFLLLGAAIGVLLHYGRALRHRECSPVMITVLFLEISMAAAVLYHAMVSSRVASFPGSFGHYLDGTVAAEVFLLALGCSFWLKDWGPRVLVLAFLGLDLFGTHVYLLPFYGGWIREVSSGGLPAFRVLECKWSCIVELAQNLAVNKAPLFSNPYLLVLLWVLYLLATAGIAVAAFRQRRA